MEVPTVPLLLKLKFKHNAAMLDIVNNGTDNIIFKPEEMLGIVDFRSLGYYKIKQGILQQNLSKYYRFERADTLCEHFNKSLIVFKARNTERQSWMTFYYLPHQRVLTLQN